MVGEPQVQDQNGRNERLNAKGDDKDQAQHCGDITQRYAAGLGLGDEAGGQPQASGYKKRKQRGAAHDPKAAKLEQDQNDRLPEPGPISGDVHDRKPSDADSGGGGEQGNQQRGSSRSSPSDWQQ